MGTTDCTRSFLHPLFKKDKTFAHTEVCGCYWNFSKLNCIVNQFCKCFVPQAAPVE